ncbi:MAG: hypothetical protein ACR2MG_08185 [Pyrinomonadaceae bacterium]
MLVIITILLSLNILLNLAVGFLLVIALGELGTLKKYRLEFGPILSSGAGDEFDRDAAQNGIR